MNNLILLAAASEGGSAVQEVARTFGVDWQHLIAQIISFCIVCALLYKFAYKRVLTMLDDRKKQIAEGLANADKIKTELAKIEVQRQEVLMQANAQGEKLIAGIPFEVGIADKGYDSKKLVRAIRARGAEAVIPSLSNRKEQRAYDRERYKDRNLAERLWSKIKQYRRVATRYEKTARNFLGFVHVASIMVLLK